MDVPKQEIRVIHIPGQGCFYFFRLCFPKSCLTGEDMSKPVAMEGFRLPFAGCRCHDYLAQIFPITILLLELFPGI